MTCLNVHTCEYPRKFIFRSGYYDIVDCEKCALRFVNPNVSYDQHVKDVYSDDYFFGGQDGYPDYLNEQEILVQQGARYARIVNKYMDKGKVLDIGAAAGFLLAGFKNSG